MRLRFIIVRVHRYSAFVVGAWFALLGVTGAVLAFRDEVDRCLNPHLFVASGAADHTALVRVHRAATRAFPRARIERIGVPTLEATSYRVLLRADGQRRVGSSRLEAMVDPGTARVLGTRDPDARSLSAEHLVQTIHDLHHRLLLGNSGKDAVGIVGLLLVANVLIGFVLAVPRLTASSFRRAIGLKIGASRKRLIYDLHRTGGTLLGLLLFLAGLTGAMMAYPEYTRDVAGLFSTVRPLPTVPWRGGEDGAARSSPDIESVITAAVAATPNQIIREIHLPSRATAPVLVYAGAPGSIHRHGDAIVMLHAVTAERLAAVDARSRSAGEAALYWILPLHSGTAFGALGRWLMLAVGLCPLLLFVTGMILWLFKQRATDKHV